MSAICNMIQQAAHQREQLLRGLEETDSASARLMQQTRYIDDLEVQMSTTAKCAEKLRDKAMVGLREHEKYRDSTFRRLAHITSGKKEKFAEKAAKEEKEYLDALKLQKSAEDELAYTKQQRDEAEERRQEISAEAQRHENLQIELDALYDSIFAGPTPEFPEEDVKEDACDVARTHLQDVTRRLEHQQHILSLLSQIATKLSAARLEFNAARQHSLGGDESFGSMRNLKHLSPAESMMREVRRLQDQIKQATSEVPELDQLNTSENSSTKNIFIGLKIQKEIHQSIVQVDRARNQCDASIRQQRQLEKSLRQELDQAQGRLQYARVELQKVREQAFESILSGAHHYTTTTIEAAEPTAMRSTLGIGDAPPEYTLPEGPPPGYSG